jgi:hypothetical protein
MATYRQRTSPNTQAARLSAVVFTWLGAVALILAVFAILVGSPAPAYDLAPLGGLGDLTRRFGEFSPLVAASVAVIVAAVIAAMIGARRLDPVAGGLQLVLLGGVAVACVLGESGRIGHTVDGGVLTPTVICVAAAAAVVAGGIVSMLGRE